MEKPQNKSADSLKKSIGWRIAVWIPSIFGILAGFIFTSFIIAQNYSGQDTQEEELLQLFTRVYKMIKQEYVIEADSELLIYSALEGMLDALEDPYSDFLDEDELSQLQTTLSGTFGGLGMYISQNRSPDPDRLYIQILSPIDNTPAFRAGFRAGDLITKIDDQSTLNMSADVAVTLLRGTPGTEVTLTILRGKEYTFSVPITREVIEVPNIRSAVLPGNLKYIRVISFSISTGEDFRKELQDEDYAGIIVDLRGNGGGWLRGSVDLVDNFFSDGTIVSLKGRDQENEKFYYATRNQLVAPETPVIVLVDKWSASASEIFAGAIKDRRRGLLVGEKTYGKGSVQEINSFQDVGLRLTTARYYTPSGTNIDKTGIEADIVVSNPTLNDEELVVHTRIAEEGLITEFTANNPTPSEQKKKDFIATLKESHPGFSEWHVLRSIKSELYRVQHNELPVYDLEFDIPLQKAMELITTGEALGRLSNVSQP